MPAVVTLVLASGPGEAPRLENVTMRAVACGSDGARPLGPGGPGVAPIARGTRGPWVTLAAFLAAPPERGARVANFRLHALGDAGASLGPGVRLRVARISAPAEGSGPLEGHPHLVGAVRDAAGLPGSDPIGFGDAAASASSPAGAAVPGVLFAAQFECGPDAPAGAMTAGLPLALSYDELPDPDA